MAHGEKGVSSPPTEVILIDKIIRVTSGVTQDSEEREEVNETISKTK